MTHIPLYFIQSPRKLWSHHEVDLGTTGSCVADVAAGIENAQETVILSNSSPSQQQSLTTSPLASSTSFFLVESECGDENCSISQEQVAECTIPIPPPLPVISPYPTRYPLISTTPKKSETTAETRPPLPYCPLPINVTHGQSPISPVISGAEFKEKLALRLSQIEKTEADLAAANIVQDSNPDKGTPITMTSSGKGACKTDLICFTS